jgi:hypothetical protein
VETQRYIRHIIIYSSKVIIKFHARDEDINLNKKKPIDLSDKAGKTEPVGADALVVAVGAAALTRHHRLHVAQRGGGGGAPPTPSPLSAAHHHHHTRRLRQQRHAVGLQHHLVALVGRVRLAVAAAGLHQLLYH